MTFMKTIFDLAFNQKQISQEDRYQIAENFG